MGLSIVVIDDGVPASDVAVAELDGRAHRRPRGTKHQTLLLHLVAATAVITVISITRVGVMRGQRGTKHQTLLLHLIAVTVITATATATVAGVGLMRRSIINHSSSFIAGSTDLTLVRGYL